MSFLYPFYLWTLAGISVPLLIHLFGRKKGKTIYFPTLRFLKTARSKTGRVRKIEEILILMLRMLLIILLLLTLAGPVSKTKSLFLEEQFIVFILDDSFSMNAISNEKTPFERLKDVSTKTLSFIKKPSMVSLVYLSGRQEPFSHNYSEIAKIIRKSEPSYQAGNLNLAVEQAMNSMETAPGRGEKIIFFFTDLQKRVWEDFTDYDFKKKDIKFFIFDLGRRETENLSFKDMYIIPERNSAAVEIKNWGEEKATAEVTVYGDNLENRKIATLKGGDTELLMFDVPGGTGKIHGEINFRDMLDADNRSYFSFSAADKKKILLVSEDESSPFYIIKAIKAVSEPENIEMVYKKPGEIENLLLEEYQIIFIVNAGRIPEGAMGKLYYYLKEGGNIVNFPGERVIDKNFNSDWYVRENDTFLMPAYIKGKTSEFGNPVGIGYTGTSHPVFMPFGGTILEYTKLITFKQLIPVEKISGTVLLETTNDLPLLLEKKIRKGDVLFFTFLPDGEWTNLHTRPFFPVMIRSILSYLYKKEADVVVAGEKVKINIPAGAGKVYVYSPDGEKQELKILTSGNAEFFVDKPGFWNAEIYHRDGKIEKTFSANVDWKEGNLRKAGIDEIRKKTKGADMELVRDEQIEKFLTKRSKTSELSYGFLNIIMLMFLAEVVASNLLHYKKLE